MKEYYVDFSSWTVRAKSARHAKKIAIEYIKEQSMCPTISSMEETFEEIERGASEGFADVNSFCTKESDTNAFGGDTGIDADHLKDENRFNLIKQRVDREDYKIGWKKKEDK
tara:strand:- start:73 stop:408 length:336 start_codon:yes stop_codon:yes gene_type:complete